MPFADLDVHPESPARYEGAGGDGPEAAVTFRYVAAGSTAAGDGAAPEQVDPVASRGEDPTIGWSDPEGVQAVAEAVLRHYTGEEPGQAALEALVMDRGDVWASSPRWELTTAELDAIL